MVKGMVTSEVHRSAAEEVLRWATVAMSIRCASMRYDETETGDQAPDSSSRDPCL
jgi:hypothetical protein